MAWVFLERDAELEQLRQLLDGIESSGGRVVLLRGTAGVGKTVLVGRFLADLQDAAHVLLGGCDDLLTPQPFGAIWEIAREAPELAEPLARGESRAVTEALVGLLSRALRPTVLVIEDVQWADEATLDAVKYLGRRIGRTAGLLVLTYRDGEVDTLHPLRGVIGDLPPENLTRMSLAPLSAEALAVMVGDSGLDPGEVMALTGGNPLFVTEVLAWGVGEVPPSVRDSVLARCAKVSEGARRVLELVSVSPGGAERSLVHGLVAPTVEEETECAGLLRIDAESFEFGHELVRRAVESSLSPALRVGLNQQVVDEIAATADPALVVHHAREAGDAETIVACAPVAARAAQTVESHREALDHFETLGLYLDRFPPGERAALLDDQARTEHYLGLINRDTLDRAIELYRAAGSGAALARALTRAVRLNIDRGRFEDAETSAREAIEILEQHPPGGDFAYATSQYSALRMLQARFGEAIELADRAIVIGETVGDERTVIDATITKVVLTLMFEHHGFEELEECRRRAEEQGYPDLETRALYNMAANSELLNPDQAIDLCRRAHDTALRHEMLENATGVAVWLGWALLRSGDLAAAEQTAVEIISSGRTEPGLSALLARAYELLGIIQARSGRSEAPETLDRSWELAHDSGQSQHVCGVAASIAEHLWLTGAADSVEVARARHGLDIAVSLGFPNTIGRIAWCLSMVGELEGVPDKMAEVYRLAIAGDLSTAAAIWKATGFPYERAVALMHGDVDQQLEALGIFDNLGATVLADRLRRSLKAAGVTVPGRKSKAARDHAAGLTTRQAEVLELLADGYTNPQIADLLFVSPRTVESHVAAILLKLDAPDRRTAVEIARSKGLLGHR